jgi:hypothetical protein
MSQDSKPLTRPFPTVPIFISFRKLGRHDAIEWPDLIKNGAIYPVDFRRDFDPDEITASPLFRPTDDATGLNTEKMIR